MSELLVTPVDELTGLPYCFAPNLNLPPVPMPGGNIERLADWNHQFPKAGVRYSPDSWLDDLSKMALLSSRVQWVDFEEHHGRYNNLFIGPPQPQNPQQLFTTLVMAEAGFIPETAIDLSHNEPREVGLTPEQRRHLWESGQVKVRDKVNVRKYLFKYVFGQGIDHIHEGELDEFLHTFDLERRIYLGHCLAAKIVERAVEPVDAVYKVARKQKLLPGGIAKHVRDFVKPRLTVGRNFGVVSSELHKRLGAYNRQLKSQQLAAVNA